MFSRFQELYSRSSSTSRLVHFVQLLLIVILDGFSLELERSRDQTGLGSPQLLAEGQSSGKLELLQTGLFAVVTQFLEKKNREINCCCWILPWDRLTNLEDLLFESGVAAQFFEFLVDSDLLSGSCELVPVGDEEGDAEVLSRVAVDADVLHKRAGLQNGFNFAWNGRTL